MEKHVSKNRTPSRCREWERIRRNKFNDAITRLGEVVREIFVALDPSCKDAENVQYPKIEIVEKAIMCLNNILKEKTQLKAEILALKVKIDSIEGSRKSRNDASTQVFIRSNRKYVKMLMVKNSKNNSMKEKTKLNPKVVNKNLKPKVPNTTNHVPQKVPLLLPKTNDKKQPDNTIVVLPAAPYIFPQRPLLLPTVPPAFVLVDNLQSLNKPTFPLITRNSGDVTKTTMVNILPISAYSGPLSATKSKKNNSKPKIDTAKKVNKKTKPSPKTAKDAKVNSDPPQAIRNETSNEVDKTKELINKHNLKGQEESDNVKVSTINTVSSNSIITTTAKAIEVETSKETNTLDMNKTKDIAVSKEINPPKCTEQNVVTTTPEKTSVNIITSKSSVIKNTPEKETTENKSKEKKLTNLLDTPLCENPVDGGNARLELAEEFLATSPTAAFLMSFPLVSGNRADSPADEAQNNNVPILPKENEHRRSDSGTQTVAFFDKSNDNKGKTSEKIIPAHSNTNKGNNQVKFHENAVNKSAINKPSQAVPTGTVSNENPFLNLSIPSVPTTCTLTDSTYTLDFDCNISKPVSTQPTSYTSTNNIFYKSDPFSSVKSSIYSTSNISSSHDFNSFGLYPCAMDKYSSKNKPDYSNVEDNLAKIGSSRLTYDIDLGWSHKSLDFVSCTSSTATFNKDNILTTAGSQYSAPYNPFNPEFHVPLTPTTTKKDSSKPTASFAETLTSFYSQTTNLWSEEVPFYTNSNISKALTTKPQHYLPFDQMQANVKSHTSKHGETDNAMKITTNTNIPATQQFPDKYTKKFPSKMHINWMTSEIRPMQNCNPAHGEIKETQKIAYSQLDHTSKKQDYNEANNYFPINMHNFTTQSNQVEELQVWPPTRTQGTTEISIEPPPINLPTLVGDLALGPHDKKKTLAEGNRNVTQPDLQNCSNFFSVTQLMNRSTDNVASSRYQGINTESSKSAHSKQSLINDTHRKAVPRLDNHLPHPYAFNDLKTINPYETMGEFPATKSKISKPDKSSKNQKNSYSAEALIRGGNCSQKVQENPNTKFMSSSQKYNDFNVPSDSSIAQVSHFPPIIDYSDNSYASQQFSGTTLYNSTTNTMSNSFYSNFVPGSSNLMTSNYTTGPFSSEFIDYNQTTECNYTNHKYEELKIRNNPTMFQQEKVINYKSSRRETTGKHKLECSKKESSKKYQNKRAKLNTDVEEWNDTSHLLWQNKTPTKRHSNLMSDELTFSNYGNQMPTQYQPDFFNSHLVPSNMQTVGHNVDRSLSSFPVTSRANFNLSTIFPEITMKVQ